MQNDSNATGQVPVAKYQDPEAFDGDLEWLLVCGSSAMGERGTLGGVVAVLEHGGQFTGVPNTDIYTDQQVGLGPHVVGSVERHRWLSAAWDALDQQTQADLLACYTAPRAQFRSDSANRAGTEAQLGRFAGLAFWLADDPAALFVACRQPSKGTNARTIARAVRVAKERAKAAHAAWRAAKSEAQKPRKPSARRALLPEFKPTEASR